MSYCRWSSDRYQCDLYCYEDVHGGWTTHVAGRRRTPIPENIIDPLTYIVTNEGELEAWDEVNRKWGEACDAAEWINLDSPHAGKTYNDPTIQEFRARVVELSKDPALYVPDWLLPSIDEEIAQSEAEATKV